MREAGDLVEGESDAKQRRQRLWSRLAPAPVVQVKLLHHGAPIAAS